MAPPSDSQPQPLKVLVTGTLSPSSSLSSYFTKLTSLQTKHSFSLVLALDLFSSLDPLSDDLSLLLTGKIDIPVQVYAAVSDGNVPETVKDKWEKGEEICKNLTLLGKSGVMTLASGLKLAFFGGSSLATDEERDSLSTTSFTATSLNSLLTSLTPPPPVHSSLPSAPLPPPDILLTNLLPSLIPQLSTKPLPPSTSTSTTEGEGDERLSSELNELAIKSRAKYHFVSGLKAFWEREPFTWEREQGGGSCRVIGLGEMGNKSKDRWFYAFSITPSSAPTPPPPNSTPSPFSQPTSSSNPSTTSGPRGIKRPAGSLEASADVNEYGVPNYIFGGGANSGNVGGERKRGRGGPGGKDGQPRERGPPPDHYTCNICEKKGHWIQDCPDKVDRPPRQGQGGGAPHRPIQPEECWFCLSNPKVTKHLIAAIGSETYLTLPKGQLLPTTKDGKPSEVAPVPGGGHVLLIPIAHYPTLQTIPAEQSVPIVAEMEQYKSGLRNCYESFGAKLLSFEVGRLSGKGGHAHVQICPIPNNLADNAEEVFVEEGKKQHIVFEPDGTISGGDNYFKVDLPSGKSLIHLIKPGVPFGLQFGRATVATLLGIPERTDWKSCVKTDQEEKLDCQRFKAAFKKFDPSE